MLGKNKAWRGLTIEGLLHIGAFALVGYLLADTAREEFFYSSLGGVVGALLSVHRRKGDIWISLNK